MHESSTSKVTAYKFSLLQNSSFSSLLLNAILTEFAPRNVFIGKFTIAVSSASTNGNSQATSLTVSLPICSLKFATILSIVSSSASTIAPVSSAASTKLTTSSKASYKTSTIVA